METNRELLELAAKAAGIVGEYIPAGRRINVDYGEGTYEWSEHIKATESSGPP